MAPCDVSPTNSHGSTGKPNVPSGRPKQWEQTAARLDAQRAVHRAEDDEDTAALRTAEAEAERVRAEVSGPLIVQAEADGATYLAAIETETAASARLATTGRFGKRKARAEHCTATEHTQTVRAQVRRTWGEPPRTTKALPEWATRQAERRAETDLRVIDAAQRVEAARADHAAMRERHKQERRALLVNEYRTEQVRRSHLGMRTVNPHRQARDAEMRAAILRAEVSKAEADELRGLPVHEAARRIETKRAAEEARRLADERTRRLRDAPRRDVTRSDPRRAGPSLGL